MSLDSSKTRLKYAISIFFIPTYIFAKGITLMENVLEQEVKILKTKKNSEIKDKRENLKDFCIYFLSSIVYFDDEHWTIWLNDEQISPSQIQHLTIDIKVKKNSIEIKQKDKQNDFFEISPNQTIHLKNGKIYSGDKREKLEKEEAERVDGEDFDF